MQIPFVKYQGTGNDFILIDDRENEYEEYLTLEKIAFLCHRRFGIGADGLMLLQDHPELDFKMIYFNADGAESTMCGNGGRCISAFARRLGISSNILRFEAIDGFHQSEFVDEGVKLKMVQPHGMRQMDKETYWIHTGSPHYVSFEKDSLESFPVYEKGKAIRHDPAYAEGGGTNANFVHIQGKHDLYVRTFERGVEDETFSCGTGVTAAAYTYLTQQTSHLLREQVSIETLGGRLSVIVEEMGKGHERIYLQGPATFVFEGVVEV